MRIVYYSPHPTHDIVSDVGYSTHQREMIHALRNLGHEVIPVIIGGTDKCEFDQRATEVVSKAERFRFVKKFIHPYLWRSVKERNWWLHDETIAGPRLEQAIKAHNPDLVYERSEYSLKQGPLLAKKYKVKHIFEVNAPCVDEWMEFEGPSMFTPKARNIEKIKYQNSDGLCPVSSSLGGFLQSQYGLNKDRIKTITNGINPNAVKVNDVEVERIRMELGLKDDQVVVGFVGSILKYHGVDKLIEAFARVAMERTEAILMIVGDGAMLDELKEQATKMGIMDRCRFVGRIPHAEVFNYMMLIHICVSPTHSWYGSPIKLFEYAYLGKAIIAPNQENIRDVLTNNETALFMDKGAANLSALLAQLIDSKDLRTQLGGAAKKLIADNYTWESNAARLIEFANQIG